MIKLKDLLSEGNLNQWLKSAKDYAERDDQSFDIEIITYRPTGGKESSGFPMYGTSKEIVNELLSWVKGLEKRVKREKSWFEIKTPFGNYKIK